VRDGTSRPSRSTGKRVLTAAIVAVLASAVFTALAIALGAGDLDPSFSGDGVFVEPLGNGTRPGSAADAVAVQADGKVVFAGRASNSETGSFSHVDRSGANRIRFTGRVNRKALRPGRYRLSARPRFAGTKGKTAVASFRVIRR
jgi:hypothetical protein